METLNNIEYIDSEHLYLYNGVIIPSTTQLLGKIFPNKYKNVPEYILSNKAIYGTMVHNAIQELEETNTHKTTNNLYADISIAQYEDLKAEYDIQVEKQEEIVCYKGLYAGRFDIYGKIENIISLCDIKTTAELDIEYCKYQLNLYRFAHKDKNKIKKLYILWLPKKGLGKLVEVDIMSDKEIKELLKRCELL